MPHADHIPAAVRVLYRDQPARFAFSICTLMTRPDQYAEMVQSYRDAGFGDDCEYLCIDNSQGNVHDSFSGYNAFLVEAQGMFIILTHQDVLLCFDDRKTLENRLRQLSNLDPIWGACGNSGGASLANNVLRISDPHGENTAIGTFPQRVFALDENFIVVRRGANLSLSNDMSGYHMYGADLCVMADIQGVACYVIDFHLRHLSGGTLDASFWAGVEALSRKYARAFRSRWIQTPITPVFLSSARLLRVAMSSRIGRKLSIAIKRG